MEPFSLIAKSKLSLLSLSILIFASKNVAANHSVDFFEMSVEQLMNVETNVASIRGEAIAATP